jgi:hypothetical protein
MFRFPNSADVLVFFLACCRTGGLCCVRWNQVLSSLRACDRYFSFVEISEYFLHARVWDGFWLLVDFMAWYFCFGVFLISHMRVEEDVFGYVVRSVPTLWDVYPGKLIIYLDFVTRSFLDAARDLFRRFFFGFFLFVSLLRWIRVHP